MREYERAKVKEKNLGRLSRLYLSKVVPNGSILKNILQLYIKMFSFIVLIRNSFFFCHPYCYKSTEFSLITDRRLSFDRNSPAR